MKKSILIISIFTVYWGATIFFTLPENYLKIKALKYEKIFSSFFYQRWSFFAPPPKFNDRLYYNFASQKDTIIMEAMKPIHDKRKSEYLFNNDISVVDYILSNSLNNISDIIREHYNAYKFENCDGKEEAECFKQFMDKFKKDFHKTNEVKTLMNYGKSLAKNRGLDDTFKIKFVYATVDVPAFSKRHEKESEEEKKEQFVFETDYYNLKTESWEN
ncbi:hypothetical protein [Tenacibaculum xiamenense]|uniref:hypothetical protein n=1 Tax=Tenacibaculum xiamenense TaxID=1261553 RepID=UPI0038952C9A